MDSKLIEALGDELFHALRERRSVAPLTQRYPDLTLERLTTSPCASCSAAKPWANRLSARKSG
jgi:2-keto-4-pentenoate hydratase